MGKLAKVELLPATRQMLPGRKKPVDALKLAQLKTAEPASPLHAIEELLIFDARMLDRQTQQELLRVLPELVHVRHAWKAEFLENGCIHCPPPDPTIAIAARMRRKGMAWAEIYELAGKDRAATTRTKRKQFENAVCWKLAHLDKPERKPPLIEYGSGGFCGARQRRIGARMRNRYRKQMAGRNIEAELTALKDNLALKYNAAQRLLNEGDE